MELVVGQAEKMKGWKERKSLIEGKEMNELIDKTD